MSKIKGRPPAKAHPGPLIVAGIDVGIGGAVALIDEHSTVRTIDMPVLLVKRNGKNKREVDPHALARILAQPIAHAVVELVGARPDQGRSGICAFCGCFGIVRGILAAYRVPITLVAPHVWKKELRVPPAREAARRKDASRRRASELMPQAANQWPLQKDHGKAEASLLAYWGRNCGALPKSSPPDPEPTPEPPQTGSATARDVTEPSRTRGVMALGGSAEENCLTALAHSRTLAPQIAQRLTASDFSIATYRIIAAAALDYLAKYGRPAGRHLRDLLEDTIKRGPNGQFLGDVLDQMQCLAPHLQDAYVLGTLDRFLATNRLIAAVNDASDLLRDDKLEEARRIMLHAALSGYGPNIEMWDPWGEPEPPAFDTSLLPEGGLREFVESRSAATGFDPAGFAWAAMSACSAALDGSLRLQMPDPTYQLPPALWVLLYGRASIGRTPMLRACMAPLWGLEIEAEAANERVRSVYADLNRKRPKADHENLPPPTRYVVKNATIDALKDILRQQNRGVMLYIDEWSGFIGQLDKYQTSKAGLADRADYLECWDGGYDSYDRIGRGHGTIKNKLITQLGGIQPDKLADLGKLTSDGLLQRYITPILRPKTGHSAADAGEHELDLYEALIQRLSRVPSRDPVSLITLASEARVISDRVEATLATYEAMETAGSAFVSFIGKQLGQWGRLTLVLGQILAEEPSRVIGAEAAERAERLIIDLALPYGARLHASVGGGGEVELNRKIASYILRHKKMKVWHYHLTNNVRDLRDKGLIEVQRAMSPLVAHGWCDRVGENEWSVHPQVHNQFAERAEIERAQTALYQDLIRNSAAQRRTEQTGDTKDAGHDKHDCARAGEHDKHDCVHESKSENQNQNQNMTRAHNHVCHVEDTVVRPDFRHKRPTGSAL